MRHTRMKPAPSSLGAASCNTQALALTSELQAVLDALQSPAHDAQSNPDRAGRAQRLLASRVFLLKLRLHWITAALPLSPAAVPPCSSARSGTRWSARR